MAEPWVCPWGICSEADAKACRAGEVRDKKGHLTRDTCARRFPPGTTPEEAKRMIGPPTHGSGVSPSDGEVKRCHPPMGDN